MSIGMDFNSRNRFFDYYAAAFDGLEAPTLHCFLLRIGEDLGIDDVLEAAKRRGLKTSLISRGEDICRVKVGVRKGSHEGSLIPIDNSWLFASEGDSSALTSTLRAFSNKMYPLVESAYLPSMSLLGMLERVKRKYDNVLVAEGTLRVRGGEETIRNWKKTPHDFSIRKMLQMAKREDAKWTGITLKFRIDDRDVFSCRVSESGHLVLYSGRFMDFYSDVAMPYLAEATRLHNNLRGKERKEIDGEVMLFPVHFDFPKKILPEDVSTIEEEIVEKYAAAVMHPGNPMLMMQLSDRSDGSIYDLYVFSNKVQIVPLQKATPGSLENLVSLVSDVLPAGIPAWCEH